MTRIRLDDLRAALAKRPPPSEKSESEYKQMLVAEINGLDGGYAERREDKYAVGVLDMVIKLPGLPIVFAEGKVIGGHEFHPTLAQYEVGRRLIKANIQPLLIGWKFGKMYISPWKQSADRRECHSLENKSYAESLWDYLK